VGLKESESEGEGVGAPLEVALEVFAPVVEGSPEKVGVSLRVKLYVGLPVWVRVCVQVR